MFYNIRMTKQRTYIAIDLKSFYASVECVERGLDPLTANLVVADTSRTEKTICLAVSPSLKAYGIGGRARLFEVVQRINFLNAQAKAGFFKLNERDAKAGQIEYIAATPRMALYMEYSRRIYNIYLKYVAAEDIHVYSIDEVFMDVTNYLNACKMSAHELTVKIIRDVLKQTGITATAGIGPNLYLCKIAMDVEAKHVPADKDGVRIAELDEISYREKYWDYEPITDFWRVGPGIAKRLADHGMFTMGDIARCSLGKPSEIRNEDLLYRLFGVNAELLIDHAWGWEPCAMKEIKEYKPKSKSISRGQVLNGPKKFKEGLLIAKEMADILSLELVKKNLVSDQISLYVGYDINSIKSIYANEIEPDWYGRMCAKPAKGSINLPIKTSSSTLLVESTAKLYEEIVDPDLYVRRMYIAANNVDSDDAARAVCEEEQLDLFTDYEAKDKMMAAINEELADEKKIQQTLLQIKEKYGKNAILKGMNLEEGATTRERNEQIGGHKA